MANKVTKIILPVLLFALLLNGTTAQTGCTRAMMGLSPCLNYVTGNSSTPSSSCCLQLSSVVQSQPQCLCSLLSGGASSYGININQTLALALPDACNVQTPPVSRCNGGNGPTASQTIPESPPAGSSKTPDTMPDIPSGTKTITPSSNGINVRTPSNFLGFLLFIASCALSVSRF